MVDRPKNAQMQMLKADISRSLETIEELYSYLARYPTPVKDEDQAVIAGYYLHHLYTVFEQVFKQVAGTFENEIPAGPGGSAGLLRRMTLDIEGLRPRAISEQAYECLDELRSFRQLYRRAYRVQLDRDGLALAQEKAKKLEPLYRSDLALFLDFLESLS